MASILIKLPKVDGPNQFSPNYVQELISESNLARNNPQEYAKIVQRERDLGTISLQDYMRRGVIFNGKPITQNTINEFAEPYNVAIRFLLGAQKCTNTLRLNPYLSNFGQKWVDIQGPTGGQGHGDFQARIKQSYLPWEGNSTNIAENLFYGDFSPREAVIAWIISPGHRANLFNCNFDQIGVGYGSYNRPNFIPAMVASIYGRGYAFPK